MNFHSKIRPVGPTHPLSKQQPKFPLSIALGRNAYSLGKVVESCITSSPVRMRVTQTAALAADGSSFQRGSMAAHSWSVIVSSSLVYRLTKHAK